MASPATTRISLAPTPGFCIKSTSLNSVSIRLSQPPNADAQPAPKSIPVPVDLKVFVNIAWDKHVPAPPERSEAAIERAIAGDVAVDPTDPEDWYVPVIVPEPRPDKDKAGRPSVVFDCIFSATLKSRALRSPEFKTFLIELAFQRIEAQYGLQLSRQIGTPNIASKGKLVPRSVLVPTALLAAPSHSADASAAADAIGNLNLAPTNNAPRKPLIEEVDAPTAPAPSSNIKSSAQSPKGILKGAAAPATSPTSVPSLTWSKTDDGRLRIALSVPGLTHALIPQTTLDLEPRRIIFTSPAPPSPTSKSTTYALDLDLTQPDASLEKLFATSGDAGEKSARHALTLKRERALDVDNARAEWRVADGQLVIYA
ncbi:pre-RNA processing PIH1/Nop17-domain-containing protein [Trametes polyzona]|nr:pre-RNA processing PIH1/Nop17-domain-containing protein [Trametes polyzona]